MALVVAATIVTLTVRALGGDPPAMHAAETLTPDVAGTYVLGTGEVLTLWGLEQAPTYELAGSLKRLEADDRERFLAADRSSSIRVVRDPDDKVTGLLLERPDEPPVFARKEHLHVDHDVEIDSDGASLAGTLVLPAGPGPHPAVVVVHGAEPARRHTYQVLASHLARRGVAALIYDKRGVGASSGDLASATFDDLTSDALAGLSFLTSHPDVDPSRVGILGWSQGAWIVARAAASDDVAFAVALSPSGHSPADQQAWLHGSMLAARGFDAPAMTIADRVGRMAYSSLDLVDAGLMPSIPHVPGFWFHALDPYLDTTSLWAGVQQPVLALWGELDCQVPAHDGARAIAAALEAGNNTDATLRILPGADHSFALVGPCDHETGLGSHHGYDYAEGFPGLIAEWITDLPDSARADNTPSTNTAENAVLGWHLDPPAPAPWYGTLLAQVSAIVTLLGVFATTGAAWVVRTVSGAIRRRDRGQRTVAQHLAGATALVGLAATTIGAAAIVEVAMLGDTHAAFLVGGPTVSGSSALLAGARALVAATLGLALTAGVALLRSRTAGRRPWIVGGGVLLLAAWAAYWQLLPLM